MSVYFPIHCPDYLRSAEMTEVMMNTPSMEEIGLNPRKDGLSYQRVYKQKVESNRDTLASQTWERMQQWHDVGSLGCSLDTAGDVDFRTSQSYLPRPVGL
ncbi:protein LBH isoform X3 [Felis catus]|uniref:protein LBH isoform X3 n=1 Tax=Felis catus TaxID=9685 RepID=UPI001D1A1F10|nr:protein LBH isoform X3 [Felis catus]